MNVLKPRKNVTISYKVMSFTKSTYVFSFFIRMIAHHDTELINFEPGEILKVSVRPSRNAASMQVIKKKTLLSGDIYFYLVFHQI